MNVDLGHGPVVRVHDDWLAAAELRALTPEKLVERMRELKPLLGANARETENIRKPVDQVWQAVRRSGALYLFVPKRFGGLEFDLETFIDSMLPLGEGCASTAWVTAFCVEHNWMLSQFPERAQEEIFGSFPYITAPGVTAPPGRAVPVDGGYILSGRWKFATGVMHADWVLAAGLLPDGSTPPTVLFCALPIGDVRVIDTWHVDGMVGTGSNDVEINEVFVPEYRTLNFAQMRMGTAPGARVHDNPIYRMPMLPFLALTAALPAIGNARAAVAFFRAQLKQRSMYGTSQKQEEKPAAQMRLARADIQTSVAELIVRDSGRTIMNLARGDSPATVEERISIRARIAYAMDLCRNAVRIVCESSGAGSHFLDNPLQRARRDADVMASHVVYDLDGAMELHGRALIGLPPNSPVV